MKCPICNGKGTQFVCDYDGMYDIVCYKCKGKGELDKNGNPILTNEEWIKSCNTEQLAEILVCMAEDKSEAKTVHKENVGKCVWWLKQPHTTKE